MKVKICGITHPDDAISAAEYGADYFGINFSSKSKRAVRLSLASDICAAVYGSKTQPVGIFVNESATDIITACEFTKIKIIQLHGPKARAQLPYLINHYEIFYALPYQTTSNINLPPLNPNLTLLFDNVEAGSGKIFDWHKFTPPKHRWMLAGGLNKDNVTAAIQLLQPTMVDVASGVEYNGSTRKNPELVCQFIKNARAAQ